MGIYGTTRSHSRRRCLRRAQSNLSHHQQKQTSVPSQHIRLKERIARSSAFSNNKSLVNFFGPHLIISPHDRLTLQKTNSISTRPKATITISTSRQNHDFRIRPFLLRRASSPSSTLHRTKTGHISKSSFNAVTISSNPTAAINNDDDEDETEDVEIDIDGAGRSRYDNINHLTLSPPRSIGSATAINSAAQSSLLATATSQSFGHEDFGFETGSDTAESTRLESSLDERSGHGYGSASPQQIPSLSSSVCSSLSAFSTPPAHSEYWPNTAYPYQQEELVKLKREAFQELASQTQRFDDLFIAKMIHWESLCPEEKSQWLERGHNQPSTTPDRVGDSQQCSQLAQNYPDQCEQLWKPCEQEQEIDDLISALECRATVKDYSALIEFEQQAESRHCSYMEHF
ncbi:hypothetical protein FBU30_010002 [Linnemannia zychae]|nr:hypothetical protein FBU30_010002 [Linnemannia zychae]